MVGWPVPPPPKNKKKGGKFCYLLSLFFGEVFPGGKVYHQKTNWKTKNVLWMNKILKDVTLKRGYRGIISQETFLS